MLNQLKVSLSVIAIAFLAGCSSPVASVTPNEAATMFSGKKAVIVDVRENDEWNAGHIEGAIHIPLAQVETRLSELAQYKDSPVILQCRSGKRSAKATTTLINAGFTQAYNLTGGILAWGGAGLKTVKVN